MRSARLKVMFLTTEWPSTATPTNGIFIREHAYAVSEYCDVASIHVQRAAAAQGLYDVVAVDEETLPAWRIRYRRYGRPASYAAFAGGVHAGFQVLRRTGFDPDVIHAHSPLSAFAGVVLGRLYRKPVVYTEHWTIFIPENPHTLPPGRMLLTKLALRNADAVLPVSEDLRKALALLAPNSNVRVIPNAVDERLFHPPVDRQTSPTGEKWLLTTGSLETERKGVDILLEALGRLGRMRSDFHLDVIGEGRNRGDYEDLARRLGIEQQVTFHGWRPKEAIAEFMRRSHLFVLGSRFENNPCVVIEAMATGLPVVATRVGGVGEMVDQSSGRLAEPGRPDDLARQINAALDSLGEFDPGLISRQAIATYGRAIVGRAIADVYSESIERRRRCPGSAPSPGSTAGDSR